MAWVLQTAPADSGDVQVSPDGSICQVPVHSTPRKRKRERAAGGGEGESSAPAPAPVQGETEEDPICLD